jgi:transcriptional regulator with XRE-family HTH domain/DNA-binding transcriptional ArsR family regulator
MDDQRVGARVAQLRGLRGLTQEQLYLRTGFSTSMIKKIEQGTRAPSANFVALAARALGVTPADLYGTSERQLAAELPAAQLDELRDALDSWDDPQLDGEPLTIAAIDQHLDRIAAQVLGTRYADAAAHLPAVLNSLYVLTGQRGRAGERARGALHDAYRFSATVAGRFRQTDLAAIASERHIQLAPATGDPARVAISAFHRSSRHLQRGDYAAGLRMLDRATTDLDPESPTAVQLHLRAAVLAARQGHLDRADEYVDAARRTRQDGTRYRGIDATQLNIDVHWCALPVETMDAGEALRRGREVRVTDESRPERIGHHHIDQARAALLHGDRDRTLQHLDTARRVAPFTTRHHPSVRETVLALAEQQRRRSDSLAGFARWAGLSW